MGMGRKTTPQRPRWKFQAQDTMHFSEFGNSFDQAMIAFWGIHSSRALFFHVGVSKNRGETPKMDGEHNGKPY